MPRKGKGQKIQTATNQQYGKVKEQREAQSVVPLPQMEEPPVPVMRAGEQPFARPTERRAEPIQTPQTTRRMPEPITEERKFQMLTALATLEPMASRRDSSQQLRQIVREMRVAIGPIEELGS